MTPERKNEFDRVGLTCLRGAVAQEVVAAIRERVWACAEEKMGVREDDPSTWRRVKPAILKKVKEAEGLFDPLLGPVVTEALDELLGEGWSGPEPPGTLLMTPPEESEWVVPDSVWHTDSPAPGWVDVQPGAQLFLLLDRLGPREGGTIVAGGSPRLIEQLPERNDRSYEGHSAELRRALSRRVPWVRDLFAGTGSVDERIQRFAEQATLHEDVPLQVLQMTGEPGDVFVMHRWMLHAPSAHCGERMRMVVTHHLTARGARLHRWEWPAAE